MAGWAAAEAAPARWGRFVVAWPSWPLAGPALSTMWRLDQTARLVVAWRLGPAAARRRSARPAPPGPQTRSSTCATASGRLLHPPPCAGGTHQHDRKPTPAEASLHVQRAGGIGTRARVDPARWPLPGFVALDGSAASGIGH